jgi:alkylation response protein AidB-like acyl-CoA dehydrogenase
MAFAAHSSTVLALAGDDRFTALARGETVGAMAMSSEVVPDERNGRLSGRALWVGPITARGVAIVGGRRSAGSGGELMAMAVPLDAAGVAIEPVYPSGLRSFACGHVTLGDAAGIAIGSPMPIMARVRVLLAAVGLGIGRRALAEALHAAHAYSRTGPGGEQTLQGLVADAATELDAATVLAWRAASSPSISLAEASMAKLAAADAAQRAVSRASQVAGADALRQGHILDRLAQGVRALEVFAGRTEGLREAVASETLPRA